MEQLSQTLMNRDKFEIPANVQPLYAGDVISDLKVFEVPGHSPDSILLYDEETKWQFVGDLVLNSGASYALLDLDDNMELLPTVAQQENSLKMCQQLEASMVFAGHQWPFSNLSEVVDSKLAGITKKRAHYRTDKKREYTGNSISQFGLWQCSGKAIFTSDI